MARGFWSGRLDAGADKAKQRAEQEQADAAFARALQQQLDLDQHSDQTADFSLYHATSLESARCIQAEGFRVPKGPSRVLSRKNRRKHKSGDAQASVAASGAEAAAEAAEDAAEIPKRGPQSSGTEQELREQLVLRKEMDDKEMSERKFQEKSEEQGKDSNEIVDCSLQQDMAQSECCVCLDTAKSHAFVPCGHLCVCAACAESIMSSSKKECPSCRGPAAHVMKIFQ
jgi:hypothetical protein